MVPTLKFTDRETQLVFDNLIRITKSSLTDKQFKTLELVETLPDRKATKLDKELRERIGCSQSTVWNILRSLRSLKLIEYNKNTSKVELTLSGELIRKHIQEEDRSKNGI